ncbi:MAG TPA: hypothetical protein VHB25_03850 [Gemmatimonadaceae bacterium]|nr:hypothetical protein [Gemmatimonadaceae bacterium]
MAGRQLPRPGCVIRSALVMFAVLFLPMAIWFAYANWRRYWGESLVLISVSILFLRWAFSRDEHSLLAAIDELGERRP